MMIIILGTIATVYFCIYSRKIMQVRADQTHNKSSNSDSGDAGAGSLKRYVLTIIS